MKKTLLLFAALLFISVNLSAKETENVSLVDDVPPLTCEDVAWDYAARTAPYGSTRFWISYGYALGLCEEANK